eukprot:gnl/TRDRNA2_/TRDRNA2_126521_c0_seq1.p1 gnl/TRDRNA2_/TRDRNA2_126521_c0~~gnl/TRDRNA2_/TRDRNA2_126521_c0_seq1.p1  ORF type:complete len:341 (-),score=80.62 gnl/TRDRNA2_/TRDRNA2_126521_c0_seq1:438-1460(-)
MYRFIGVILFRLVTATAFIQWEDSQDAQAQCLKLEDRTAKVFDAALDESIIGKAFSCHCTESDCSGCPRDHFRSSELSQQRPSVAGRRLAKISKVMRAKMKANNDARKRRDQRIAHKKLLAQKERKRAKRQREEDSEEEEEVMRPRPKKKLDPHQRIRGETREQRLAVLNGKIERFKEELQDACDEGTLTKGKRREIETNIKRTEGQVRKLHEEIEEIKEDARKEAEEAEEAKRKAEEEAAAAESDSEEGDDNETDDAERHKWRERHREKIKPFRKRVDSFSWTKNFRKPKRRKKDDEMDTEQKKEEEDEEESEEYPRLLGIPEPDEKPPRLNIMPQPGR